MKMDEEKSANNWIALVHESYKYGKKGDYWRSIELAEKALQLDPTIGEAWRLIGVAYEFLGDQFEESGDHLQAMVYHERAKEFWKKAKEVDPNAIVPGLGLKGIIPRYLKNPLVFGLIILVFAGVIYFLLEVLK